MFDFSLVSMAHMSANYEQRQVLEAYEILKQGISQKIKEAVRTAENDEVANNEHIDDLHVQRCDLFGYSFFFGVVMAYAVLENFVKDVYNHSKLELRGELCDDRSPGYEEMLKALQQLGIDIEKSPFDSAALKKFALNRGRIMHSLGSTLGRWNESKQEWIAAESIQLSDQYVYDCIGLVGFTCEEIAERYEKIAKAAGEEPTRV